MNLKQLSIFSLVLLTVAPYAVAMKPTDDQVTKTTTEEKKPAAEAAAPSSSWFSLRRSLIGSGSLAAVGGSAYYGWTRLSPERQQAILASLRTPAGITGTLLAALAGGGTVVVINKFLGKTGAQQVTEADEAALMLAHMDEGWKKGLATILGKCNDKCTPEQITQIMVQRKLDDPHKVLEIVDLKKAIAATGQLPALLEVLKLFTITFIADNREMLAGFLEDNQEVIASALPNLQDISVLLSEEKFSKILNEAQRDFVQALVSEINRQKKVQATLATEIGQPKAS